MVGLLEERTVKEEKMSIETYYDRARRLQLDPTQVCIACGHGEIQRIRQGNRFCKTHVNWESAALVKCAACGFEVGLTCSQGVKEA